MADAGAARAKAERKAEFERQRAASGGKLPAKKQLTKAERRELQEKQRAAKAAQGDDQRSASPARSLASTERSPRRGADNTAPPPPKLGLGGCGSNNNNSSNSNSNNINNSKAPQPAALSAKPPPVAWNMAQPTVAPSVLAHLGKYSAPARKVGLSSPELHPAVIALGLRYASGQTDGANGRCVAILAALKEAIKDYVLPSGATVCRDLDKKLKPMINHLFECRPHSASMGHAIKHVRSLIANLEPNADPADAKRELCEAIDRYVHERIVLPGTVIAQRGLEKIRDGDVILTYGPSDAAILLLATAKRAGRRFRVIVVDSRPTLSGRALFGRLGALGIDTTYVWLHAISYACREANKVIIGADALLSNGAVLARAGTASIAMMASAHNIPVLVCCETYKFHDRVQLDSVCWNELGDPAALRPPPGEKTDTANYTATTNGYDHTRPSSSPFVAPRGGRTPQILHLRFDVTPPTYVDVIVTEHGLVPPSACAVLIRELSQTIGAAD